MIFISVKLFSRILHFEYYIYYTCMIGVNIYIQEFIFVCNSQIWQFIIVLNIFEGKIFEEKILEWEVIDKHSDNFFYILELFNVRYFCVIM